MKIAVNILSAKSLHHGMGIYVSNLLKRLIPIAKEHNFIIYKNSGVFSDLISYIEQNKTPSVNKKSMYKNITKNRYLRILWEYMCLPILLKLKRTDIFWGPSNFLPPVKMCKYVVTIHDLSSFVFAQSYPLIRRKYYQFLILNAIRRADCIIADSESTKNDLIKHFQVSTERIKVIYNGVDEIFKPVKSNDKIIRVKQKYNLPSEFIFSLGVLEPKKNIERLISAYVELKQLNKVLPKLVIGGSRKYGWKNSKVFQLVKIHNLENDIIFTDFIDYNDLPIVYSLAKLFVFPSIYEGFGLPVVEAMACGTPVITSNTSSLPEVAGNAAVLVNPYDVEKISQAIGKVLTNERLQQEMREKGIENAKRFSWERAAIALLDVFEDIAKR